MPRTDELIDLRKLAEDLVMKPRALGKSAPVPYFSEEPSIVTEMGVNSGTISFVEIAKKMKALTKLTNNSNRLICQFELMENQVFESVTKEFIEDLSYQDSTHDNGEIIYRSERTQSLWIGWKIRAFAQRATTGHQFKPSKK